MDNLHSRFEPVGPDSEGLVDFGDETEDDASDVADLSQHDGLCMCNVCRGWELIVTEDDYPF